MFIHLKKGSPIGLYYILLFIILTFKQKKKPWFTNIMFHQCLISLFPRTIHLQRTKIVPCWPGWRSAWQSPRPQFGRDVPVGFLAPTKGSTNRNKKRNKHQQTLYNYPKKQDQQQRNVKHHQTSTHIMKHHQTNWMLIDLHPFEPYIQQIMTKTIKITSQTINLQLRKMLHSAVRVHLSACEHSGYWSFQPQPAYPLDIYIHYMVLLIIMLDLHWFYPSS